VRRQVAEEFLRPRHLNGDDEGVDLTVVDDAVDRLIAGTASKNDYDLLLERRYWSVLAEFGDPARLPKSLAAIRNSADPPPWADCRDDQVWAELVRSGDANRLLDMEPAMLMFRLPDAELDASLAREAASGAYATVERTLRDLDPYVQRRIALPPRPMPPGKRLERELRALNSPRAAVSELVGSTLLSDEERCRLSVGVLARDPGHPGRRHLQLTALRHLPAPAGTCLLQTPRKVSGELQSPGLPRWLLTRAEYDGDPELREALLAALVRWIPAQEVGRFGSLACVPYRSVWGEALWRLAKDWRGSRSGSWVHLEFLELPAAVLAGHVLDLGVDAVVAAPCTPFSTAQPGQASLRVAQRVSELSGVPFVDALRKDEDGGVALVAGASTRLRGRRVMVVDDQSTRGGTFSRCLAALADVRASEVVPLSWSSSAFKVRSNCFMMCSAAGWRDQA
jgi:hypothetical protein